MHELSSWQRLLQSFQSSYFATADFCFRMICARARKELFTASAFGKARATSGSSTTTFVPSACRRAYLPRTPAEKS